VIVIVMALTILGLSLFSLSGYEAQFFRPTLDQAQAMQSTRGGIEWARFVLQSTDSLDVVRTAARPAGVTGVVARAARFDSDTFDTADSTGAVFVDPPRPVWVRAVGSMGGQQGAVLAKFQPATGVDLYKRLMTVMDSVVIFGGTKGTDEFGNTLLLGNIRAPVVKDYDGTIINPATIHGPPCVAPGSFPPPEQDLKGNWWQQKYAAATYLPAGGGQITLGPTGPDPGIYRTDPGEVVGGRSWSVGLDGSECTVNVRGTSIWMFPDGLRCEKQLQIKKIGSNPAVVILVSRPGPPTGGKEDDIGFALLGGLDVDAGISLFIVSSGGVEIEHWLDATQSSGSANYVSIYANYVKLMGPKNPGNGNGNGNVDMSLNHGSCSTSPNQDLKNGLVDKLIDQDLLPNSRFARKRLQLVSGGWSENSVTVGN
jgi:hypothetical protein